MDEINLEYTDEYEKLQQQVQITNQPGNYQQTNETLNILMVAEKNSIARAITIAFGVNYKSNKGRVSCFYFSGEFRGQRANFRVTATNGHLYGRDFPKEYADWDKIDPQLLFKAETFKKPVSKGMIALLQRESKNCDYLILWLDNDREGENICFEVEDVCKPFMRKLQQNQVYRAKFSSITSGSLKQAYQNLVNPNQLESLSVDARQIIDLKVGVAFSRFQSMYFGKKYPQLKNRLITYGPCQTPTLGFCVQRYEDIQQFKPQIYYQIVATVQSMQGFQMLADFEGERIWSEKESKEITQKLKQIQYFDVVNQSSSQKTKPRPEGVNTVNLLKFASSFLSIGPQQAMHMAEKLYLSGYISYPRTESTSYPQDFDSQGILKALSAYSAIDIKTFAGDLIKSGHQNPRQGTDVGDHPPITPTTNIPNQLLGADKQLYEYLVKMFLAAHSDDCSYINQKISLRGLGVNFSLQGNKIIEKGFTKIANWLQIKDDAFEGRRFINEDGKVQISKIEYKQGQTSPPDYLSESELLSLLESNGIGTDASMATHINNICERGYVKVDGSRRLMPTELGICLVKGYKRIDPELVSPQIRSTIENQCSQIAKGKQKYNDVVNWVIRLFEEKYTIFKSKIDEMDKLIGPKCQLLMIDDSKKRGSRGGVKNRGRRQKNEEDQGPSQAPTQVTISDFIVSIQEKKSKIANKDDQKQVQIKNSNKKDFKSKRDGELLY